MISNRGLLVSTVASLVLFGVAGVAEEAAAAKTQRVGVVDMDRVERETAIGKEYLKRIEALATNVRKEGLARQERLAEMAQEVQRQNDEFRQRQPSMDPIAANEEQMKLARAMRERDIYQQESEDEMARLERRLQRDTANLRQELRQELAEPIRAAMRKHGVDVLLDYRICLAVGPEADLTDELISVANAAKGVPKAAE